MNNKIDLDKIFIYNMKCLNINLLKESENSHFYLYIFNYFIKIINNNI